MKLKLQSPFLKVLQALSKCYNEPIPEDQSHPRPGNRPSGGEQTAARHTPLPLSPADDTKGENPAAAKEKPYWRESPEVVALDEYLKTNSDIGATVVLSLDNQPAMRFAPGLSLTDSRQRWNKASHALFLFSLALPDIRHLLKFKLINIPAGWGPTWQRSRSHHVPPTSRVLPPTPSHRGRGGARGHNFWNKNRVGTNNT